MSLSARTVVGSLVLLVAAAAVAGGLAIIESPKEARMHRLDERRVQDLRQAASAIDLYWARHKTMPESIPVAAVATGWESDGRDPTTGEPYGYRVIEGAKYELCATFERTSDLPPATYGDPLAAHGSGHQCFAMEAKDRK